NDGSDFLNFRKFCEPIIKALKTMGVIAELSGRNDLLIDGKKFSGNAQCVHKNRILHHGTLMFKTNIGVLSEVLNVDSTKISSKGIASVKSRVTNVSEHLKDNKITVLDFRDRILCSVSADFPSAVMYDLTDEDIGAINKLKNEKYDTWEWNFGFSPRYTYSKKMRFPGGGVEVYLDIKSGIITSAKVHGDFFAAGNIAEFEDLLVGAKHNHEELSRIIENADTEKYFGKILKEELLEVLV
ncbi:MAG TPA: lipoate--protein ligase, partial [Candidatus Moranbacteria bacterium]|nr:lipoate--protein ligase [Candidatus Moranbacteria bacterium]